MKNVINVVINSSYFPYWDRDVPVIEVLPEYSPLSANDLLVMVANHVQIIGLYYAEDIGEECEIPGLLCPMTLSLINPLELELLYEDNFNDNHSNFSMDMMKYLRDTDSERWFWLNTK